MNVAYRPAVPADAAACIDLRGRTRENAFSAAQLAALGITVDSWAAGIAQGGFPGHVAEADGGMVGYCFGDRDSGEIIVLALLPAWEGKGIGKARWRGRWTTSRAGVSNACSWVALPTLACVRMAFTGTWGGGRPARSTIWAMKCWNCICAGDRDAARGQPLPRMRV